MLPDREEVARGAAVGAMVLAAGIVAVIAEYGATALVRVHRRR
ncbi:hypothetical protein OG705_36725 [Streptomyces sp. NBC_00838]|nr:hypothetical protein OG705_36725 [Streptomyces sp. NBC_00838]